MQDPILFWNHLCNEANRFDHTAPMKGASQGGPTRSSRATAIVHLAMHDAFFGVAGGTPLYVTAAKPFGSDSEIKQSSAVTGAAHTILCTLYPQQTAMFDNGASDIAVSNGIDAQAHEYGRQIALKLIALRKDDGADAMGPSYVYSSAKPHHRYDPLNPGLEPLGFGYGQTKLFATKNFHEMETYPPFKSADYNLDSEEVRKKGGAASQAFVNRTTEETAIGLYWAYDGATQLGTPPRLYNQVVRVIADNEKNSWADNARLFALVNVAMGDSGIHAWHWKYHYDLWRPIVGLREYDSNFGPDSTGGQVVDPKCDPFWRPLGAPKTNDTGPGFRSFTPPFPAYPSGHATFGAAAFEMVRLFYRKRDKLKFKDNEIDNIKFEFISDELNGKSKDNDGSLRVLHKRKYRSMADAIYENSTSRIWLGVHWRFDGTSAQSIKDMMASTDKVGGVPLGLAIARDIFDNGLKQSTATPPKRDTPPD